jgi:GTPase SAR1 family protein
MYDVRSRDSFVLIQDLHRRIQEVLAVDKRQHYGLMLIGNKADGEGPRMVSEGEGYELARNLAGGLHRCAFRETSAKTGENVDNIFVLLGGDLLKLRRLAQQRREQVEELARMAAMADVDGKDLDEAPKRLAKWRAWSRPWFRRAPEDMTRKATVV